MNLSGSTFIAAAGRKQPVKTILLVVLVPAFDVEQIAALVRESNPVCLLPWRNEGHAARNDCTLYVYQTQGMDAGRYTTDILSVIESFVPDIDLFTEQDVEKLLFESAPIRARHDVLDAAV